MRRTRYTSVTETNRSGRAAAISVVLFAIVMVLTVVQMKLFTRGEEDYA